MSLLSRFFGQDTAGWIEVDQLAAAIRSTSAAAPASDGASAAAPILIDVRNPDEFSGPLGHITGARNIPLPMFAAAAGELVGLDRPLVLICHTDRRSSAAASHLRQLGVTDIAVLRGGMMAWRSAGQID